MAGDIKLVGGGVSVVGSLGIGTDTPARTIHSEGSEVHSGGSGAGFSFGDRGKPFTEQPHAGERWVWYSQSGTARLWSGADKFTFNAAGDVHATGKLAVNGAVSFGGGDLTVERFIPGHSAGQISFPETRVTVLSAQITGFNTVGVGINTATPAHTLDVNGDAHIAGTLTVQTLQQTSSRDLKRDIAGLSGETAAHVLKALRPVSFHFKDDTAQTLQFGFIAEDVPEEVASSNRRGINAMNVVAVLTQVLKDQHRALAGLAAELALLKQAQV